jgi:hypothetical protein
MSETSTIQPGQLPWIKSPNGVLDVYANAIHLTWTLDDVRIRLAQSVDNPKTPNPGPGFQGAVEERAAVTFSWRVTKALRDQLTAAIDNFERTNGPIKVDLKLPLSI